MILIDSGGNHRRSDGFLVETPQFNLGYPNLSLDG